jgi:pseudaminic acid synthase
MDGEARKPWDWRPKLKKITNDLEMHCFSSALDDITVDFLEEMGVPAHKVECSNTSISR